jgi:hypothetical protein
MYPASLEVLRGLCVISCAAAVAIVAAATQTGRIVLKILWLYFVTGSRG